MKENTLPKLGVHVDINPWTLDRVQSTGHPRLLNNLLTKKLSEDIFPNVTITAIRLEGKEVTVP